MMREAGARCVGVCGGAVGRVKGAVGGRLIPWFRRAGRVLPWRREPRSCYGIWVSEVMLQQTRVETVVPYFERFMRDYPTVGALARAELGEVLKHWEGLGYYARARHLHEAAKRVVAEHGGEVPRDPVVLGGLPGLGRYTVAAIASLGWGAPLAVLDGNVMRVLTRLFGLGWDIGRGGVRARLQLLADALLVREAAGVCNEAWMELGAMVCRVRGPLCGDCPLGGVCAARKGGEVTRFPVRGGGRRVPHRVAGAGVLRDGAGRVLIVRRSPEGGGLLAGLWRIPAAEVAGGGEVGLRRAAEGALRAAGVGGVVEAGAEVAVVRHGFSHFTLETHAFEVRHGGRLPVGEAGVRAYAGRGELGGYAFAKTDILILRRIGVWG